MKLNCKSIHVFKLNCSIIKKFALKYNNISNPKIKILLFNIVKWFMQLKKRKQSKFEIRANFKKAKF